MTLQFDNTQLLKFMQTFYGFGNYLGDYWFIGMEEGGGNTFESIQSRFKQWELVNHPELEDLYEHAMGLAWGDKYFGEKPKLQRYWSKLIRLLFVATNADQISNERIKQFQREQLGRITSKHCLLELFPLPSPSTSLWPYAQHSDIPFLQTRKAYREALADDRIEHLKNRVTQYKPKVVVFFGLSYQQFWQKIANVPFDYQSEPKCLRANTDRTCFWVVAHPASRGVTNRYFEEIGQQIAHCVGEKYD